MRPILQTRFGYPHGNCEQAALASLLEVELAELEPWPTGLSHPTGVAWEVAVQARLGGHGVELHWWEVEHAAALPLEGFHLRCGPSPKSCIQCEGRGDPECPGCWPGWPGHSGHTVIYKGEQLVHDPHPDGSGLLVVAMVGLLCVLEEEHIPGRYILAAACQG